MSDRKLEEVDAAVERATLRRERLQLLERLGPVTELIAASIAAGNRGDWGAAREPLHRAEKILQLILDEASDRVLMEDASQERADCLARERRDDRDDRGARDEERYND